MRTTAHIDPINGDQYIDCGTVPVLLGGASHGMPIPLSGIRTKMPILTPAPRAPMFVPNDEPVDPMASFETIRYEYRKFGAGKRSMSVWAWSELSDDRAQGLLFEWLMDHATDHTI